MHVLVENEKHKLGKSLCFTQTVFVKSILGKVYESEPQLRENAKG